MSLVASLSILFLALLITGSPLEVRNSSITLPLTRRLNFSNGTINFLQHDEARVATLEGYNAHDRRANSVFMISRVLVYTVTVGVGSPPIAYNLAVSSGSSVTWVGVSTPYRVTDTSVSTGRPIRENYGTPDNPRGFFAGTMYRDTVTLGDGLTVTDFKLGVADTAERLLTGEDGILGLGPQGLSRMTMPLAMDDTIPTITDCLFEQGRIRQSVVGIFLQPVLDPDNRGGELTFGRPDHTRHTGRVFYTSITDTPPSSRAWGIKQRITYGQEEILGTTDGIVDIGTNLIFIASDAYERYKTATGGTLDLRTGLLRITSDQYSALQNLNFYIEGQLFSLTPDAQIWPRSLNPRFHPDVDFENIYLAVADIGTPSGVGLDFRLGHPFMQRFYTVLDGSRRLVGFAQTYFTEATINQLI
ncbi:aspartic peptidase domain-containing protein [Suillus spraguei]|nr:aspartic peptidase domain-containing protein [Suillus spraguei]